MKTQATPFSWIREAGYRLDCGPYMSGAFEARLRLRKLRVSTDPLSKITSGIFHAGRESRAWVTDRAYGVPFLSSSDILKADLSDLPLISNKQVAKTPEFIVREGWTLVSRSGTIGRMAFVRSDMDGMACSEHAMRIVPDVTAVPAGYLHAFLRSQFGVPMVIGGTYGSIIQSIEPEHVADLPVPRFGDSVEARIDDLVQRAARLRVDAASTVRQAVTTLEATCGLPPIGSPLEPTPFCIRAVQSRLVPARLDAFFHSDYHEAARRAIQRCKCGAAAVSRDALSIIEPTRMRRIHVDDPSRGVPFFGTSALFWNEPLCSYHIPKKHPSVEEFTVHTRTLLIPRSGQLSGIIGRVVFPYGDIVGAAVSEDAIRINCRDEVDAGFLFVALSSEYGKRQLKARAYGSSIPHLDVDQIGQVLVPDVSASQRTEIGLNGARAAALRGEAIACDREARAIVEQQIVEAT